MRYLKLLIPLVLLCGAVHAQFQYAEFELLASRTETATDTLGVPVSSITQITNNDRTGREQAANDRLNKVGGDMRCYLDVTAFAGTTPTLNVDIIGVVNSVDYVVGSFTEILETNAKEAITIIAAPDDLDVDWLITGSAGQSYTFNIQCHRT